MSPQLEVGQCYLYAVVDASTELPTDEASTPLGLVRSANLAAVVGPLTEEALRLVENDDDSDLRALEAAVRAHETVIEALLCHTSVVPLRFGTIAESPEGAASVLAANEEALSRSLRRVRGRREWAVHLGSVPSSRPAPGPDRAAQTGRDYLRHRATELDLQSSLRRELEKWTESVLTALDRVAADRVVLAGRPHAFAGPVTPVADLAILLDRGAEDSLSLVLEDALAEYGGDLVAEVTGPWPPYHFVCEIAP